MTSGDGGAKLWMALETYTKSRLRDNEGKIRIELTLEKPYDNERSFMCKEENSREDPTQRTVKVIPPVSSAWLSKQDDELVEMAKDIFEENEDKVSRSMSVSVIANSASDILRHLSFGFYRDSRG